MFALIPGLHLGWPAAISAILGEIFVGASLLSLYRLRREQPGEFRARCSSSASRSSSPSSSSPASG